MKIGWMSLAIVALCSTLLGCDAIQEARLDTLYREHRMTCTGEESVRCLNLRVKYNTAAIASTMRDLHEFRASQHQHLSDQEFSAGIAALERAIELEEADRPWLISRLAFSSRRPFEYPDLPWALISPEEIADIFLLAAERQRVSDGGSSGLITSDTAQESEPDGQNGADMNHPANAHLQEAPSRDEIESDVRAHGAVVRALRELQLMKDRAVSCENTSDFCRSRAESEAARAAVISATNCEAKPVDELCFSNAELHFSYAFTRIEKAYVTSRLVLLDQKLADPYTTDPNARSNILRLMESCKNKLLDEGKKGDEYYASVEKICEPEALSSFLSPVKEEREQLRASLAELDAILTELANQSALDGNSSPAPAP